MRVAREFRIFTNVLNSIVDPRTSTRSRSSSSRATSASSRRTPSPWRARSSTSASRATSSRSPSASRPTPAAASSPTSRRSSPSGKGYVTLEISNTTPLPAKIYANEGIAQVLFFKARKSRSLVQGQEGEVPGPERRDAAEVCSASKQELSRHAKTRSHVDDPRIARTVTALPPSRRMDRPLRRAQTVRSPFDPFRVASGRSCRSCDASSARARRAPSLRASTPSRRGSRGSCARSCRC